MEKRSEPAWISLARDRIAEIRFPTPDFVREDYVSLDSYQQRLNRRKAAFRWALDLGAELFVTIKFNECLGEHAVWQRLRRFDALLNHYWLGRNWANLERFPTTDRVFFVAFVEADKVSDGVHVHLLLSRPRLTTVKLPVAWRIPLFSKHLTELARHKGICPCGDVHVSLLADGNQEVRATAYSLKEFGTKDLPGWNWGTALIISTEFHPSMGIATRPSNSPTAGNAKSARRR